MEKFFKLKEHGTDVKTELIAGITTFMTMAYILAVNPNILGAAGMDGGSVFTATALASALASFCMALFANLPFALSAGMGLNAYFTYTVVQTYHYPWQVALAAVFTEGILFILLTFLNVREAIFNAIPKNLKLAVSVGIGLFICFIGLQNSHIVTDSSTLVTLFSFHGSIVKGTFHTEGITVLLAFIGIVITAVLVIKNIKGNILIGILATWILGSMAPTFMKMDFSQIRSEGILSFIVVVFAFLFVDIFDTIGTLVGCASKADMLDQEGKLPGIKGALLADSVGTTIGAMFGTSTITTFVESSAGIAEGGRTGLTAIVTGALFLLSLFFSPLFLTIPSFATAPALIVVGFFMTQQVAKIEWNQLTEAIPCFICITSMAFMYSISEGISFGIISYTLLNSICGKRKNVSILMWILTVIFILKYRFI